MKVNIPELKGIITRFKKLNILVIGDLILDHYIFGNVGRISPEAPVPVVWAGRERHLGGGTANVGLNILDVGAKASLCGVIGDDFFGRILTAIIKEKGIDSRFIFKDDTRPTTRKTRVIAQHQQVVRVDWESIEEMSQEMGKKILRKIKKHLHEFDAIIVEDYGKGMITPFILEELVALCKEQNKIITVDPKEDHFSYYREVTALTPNLKEAEIAAGMRVKVKTDIHRVGELIFEKLNPQALLVTLGEEGMLLFSRGGKKFHIPTSALEVYDVTGAGDTVIALFTLALASKASYLDAAILANFGAGIVVGKLGASTTQPQELIDMIDLTASEINIQ